MFDLSSIVADTLQRPLLNINFSNPCSFFSTSSSALLHPGHDMSQNRFQKKIDQQKEEENRIYAKLKNRIAIGMNTFFSNAEVHPSLDFLARSIFTKEEAAICGSLPYMPTPAKKLAKKFKMTEEEFLKKCQPMCEKGVLYQFSNMSGKKFIVMPDFEIGWFEFYWMRNPQSKDHPVPSKKLAQEFRNYLRSDYKKKFYAGKTPFTRSFVREESIGLNTPKPDNDKSQTQIARPQVEIFDYETATKVIKKARTIGVGLCSCRSVAKECGEDIGDLPLKTCMTFNNIAENLHAKGVCEKISAEEALRILDDCKKKGLVQNGDNSQQPSFMCNCDRKFCDLIHGMNEYMDIKNDKENVPILSSNFIASIDGEYCSGCGICSKFCPSKAIQPIKVDLPNSQDSNQKDAKPKKSFKMIYQVDKDMCLGCGVCETKCKGLKNIKAVKIEAREQRVFVPNDFIQRTIMMGIERKRLEYYVFPDPDKISHKFLRSITRGILSLKPVDYLMNTKPIKRYALWAVIAGCHPIKNWKML